MAMLCSLWDDFSKWVTLGWSQTVYIIVMCILGVLGMMGLLSFLKQDKWNKDKKPFKWGVLFMSLLMFGLIALFSAARFA